jgi:hypothetical protein
MVAFNTSSGMPVTFVQFQDAEGRANSGLNDGGTNAAEAGTISMEFTTIGRLLGKRLAGKIASALLSAAFSIPARSEHCRDVVTTQNKPAAVCGSTAQTALGNVTPAHLHMQPSAVQPQLSQHLTYICHESHSR